MIVCRRRAPMFSVPSFTRKAKRATSSSASGVNSSLTPSVSSSATYCRVSEDFGSVRMRTKSSMVSDCSSTRMGKRPCNSGIRSLGFETWKAPAAMNKMWSVRTMPAFTTRDLVDLVEEDDAGVFDSINRDARDLLHVNQALLFFLDQVLESFVDLHLPLLGALAEDVGQHVLEIDVHFLDALVGDDFKRRKIALAGFDFDSAVVEVSFAQLLTQFLPGAAGGFRQKGGGIDDHASRRTVGV